MSLLHKLIALVLVLACLFTGVVSQKGKKAAKKAEPKKAAPKCKGKKCPKDDDDDDDDDDEEEEKPKKKKEEKKKAEPKKAKGKKKWGLPDRIPLTQYSPLMNRIKKSSKQF